ncbi:hypothetical protein [Bifidobacterium phasiani]|uniref:Phage protein n=1 Tax=Bifidobacterium phasiani TaxID=2834431 RepID=A0ABS6W653_9BIFI|nr:hypothetical protein [Bifidobacterium phasiani]MBW3081970.1 hypothetical protein [Bifidobacterium phasiani]
MAGMMRGETILLTTRHPEGADDAGDTIWLDDDPVEVDDVLVAPASTADAGESTRPDGVNVDLTLLFPRTFAPRDLRRATCRVRGDDYRVVGNPTPIDGGMTPTRWNMSVDVERGEG